MFHETKSLASATAIYSQDKTGKIRWGRNLGSIPATSAFFFFDTSLVVVAGYKIEINRYCILSLHKIDIARQKPESCNGSRDVYCEGTTEVLSATHKQVLIPNILLVCA